MEQLINIHDTISKFGVSYKKYRKQIGLTQKRLSEITGLSLYTISQFENGKGQGLSFSNLCQLLQSVGLVDKILSIIPDIYEIDLAKEWKQQSKKTKPLL